MKPPIKIHRVPEVVTHKGRVTFLASYGRIIPGTGGDLMAGIDIGPCRVQNGPLGAFLHAPEA